MQSDMHWDGYWTRQIPVLVLRPATFAKLPERQLYAKLRLAMMNEMIQLCNTVKISVNKMLRIKSLEADFWLMK